MAGAGLGAGVNKSTEAVVDGAASTTTRQRSWSDALATPLRSLFAAASLFSASEEQLKGGIIPDGANDADYIARGTRYSGIRTAEGGGAVGVKISYDDTNSPTGRSAIWASGTIYNERTVLCSLHGFNQPGARYEVRIGQNIRTNCSSIHAVERVAANPLVKDDSSRQFTFDLTVLTLSSRIEGTLPATLSTNRLPAGSNVMLAGYGRNGTLSTGYSARSDGNARAGISRSDSIIATGEDPKFYIRTQFSPTTPGSMAAAPGDSGGQASLVDEPLVLRGLIVSGSGLGTTLLDFSHPEVTSFIRKNAAPPDLSIQRHGDGVVVTWPYSPGFHLQTAPTPQGPWTDSTNAPTVVNLQAKTVFNNELDSTTKLFRLRNEGP